MRRVAFGPPGTGKTSHIREAVEALISEGLVSPSRTYLLSFSRAGAAELAGRIANKVNIGTIHSLCYRMAGLSRGRVIDNRKLKDYADYSGIEIKLDRMTEDGSMEELTEGEMAYTIYALARARCEDPLATYRSMKHQPKNAVWFNYFIATFEKWKDTWGYVDFNDMLLLGEKRADGFDADLLVVDEAQDLSEQQWRVVRKLAERSKNFIVAGDDDQAIFAWAGADPSGMVRFKDQYAEEQVILDRSHRLPKKIKEVSEALILRVADRVEKPFEASEEEGSVTTANSVVSAISSERDTMILYRNHSLRKEFERDLIDRKVPYINLNGRAAPLCSPMAALVRELEVVPSLSHVDRSISWGLDRWFRKRDLDSYENGHIGLKDLIQRASYDSTVINYLTDLMGDGRLSDVKPTVRLSSIHGSKGREAEHVVLINGTTTNSLEAWENDTANEIRVWYVGMTRAKKELTIVEAENPVELINVH